MKQIILVTMGDPAGIGPEIIVKAFTHSKIFDQCLPVVVGDSVCLKEALALTNLPMKLREISSLEDAVFAPGILPCLNLDLLRPGEVTPGQVSARCGAAAYAYIARAVELVRKGSACGIVTAPVNKEALNRANCPYPGHTEILAALSGTKSCAMMLVSGSLRVIHCTTHMPLRQACEQLSAKRVRDVIRLGCEALRRMGIDNPRIAVSGLNPHASENGLFGREETEVIIPGIELARHTGIQADGPLPPDIVFVKAIGGLYDLVVAMYHDQGHIPVKLAGFHMDPQTGRFTELSGVNVTVGLPFVRTSVDHGTAFDQAGRNEANPQSMIEAIRLAGEMAGQRNESR